MTETIRLLAFGGAKSILGSGSIEFPWTADCTVKALLAELCRQYPDLKRHEGSIRLAINGTYAAADERINPGDEVALIPPVAGG